MTIIVYGIKNCDTVKKALNWLSAHHVEHRLHDYRVDGLDVNCGKGFWLGSISQ